MKNAFLFDDITNIVENAYIRNIKDIPLLLKGLNIHKSWFRALPTFSFAANYYIHRFDVFGYHLVNLLLHILSGILVYFISRNLFLLGLKRVENPNLLSLLCAVIFIAHPIQVNTVTYIVQRNEGLASFFYLLCLLLFIQGALSKGGVKLLLLLGVAFAFFCSIFSKEIGFTLPIALILFDALFICKGREEIIKRVKIYFPFLLSLFIYILFFLKGGMLRLLLKGSEEWRWSPWENLLTQANVVIQYFKLLLFPLPKWLNVDHDFQVSRSLFEYPTLISVILILLLFTLAISLIRKNRLVFFCIGWFFFVLAPTSSLIPIWDIMVEYRLYLPTFSYAILLTLGLHYLHRLLISRYPKRRSHVLVLGVSILILIFYSYATIERNTIFKDDLTLWSDAVKKSPNKIRPKINLIASYHRYGLYHQAIATSLELLKREPHNYEIYTKLGVSYMFLGEYEKAIENLRRSIEIKKDDPKAFNNLGVVYSEKKDFDQAIAEFKQAISLQPNYAEAYNNLAKALAMKGLIDEAIEKERDAIRIDPTMAEYHFNLAKLYENRGLTNDAVSEYKESQRSNSKFFEAYFHLGVLYSKIGKSNEAILELEKALKINPQSGKSYFLLGVNFIKTRNKEKAIWSLEKALQYATNEKDRKGIESILSKLRLFPG
jgi:tetratricopeptide (TPR) repeat protein